MRFFYVPVQAFEPQPAAGATAVSIETALDWRPGREATSHTVYIGTDSNAVAEGSVAGETVDSHGFTPDSLNFATTYYWKVDEVGDTGTYAGDVWSFTTEEYASIDDFESYNDDIDAETTIWQTWIDGLTSGNSGSQVGYDVSPFAEKTIVHGGKQSMPLTIQQLGLAVLFRGGADLRHGAGLDRPWRRHPVRVLPGQCAGVRPDRLRQHPDERHRHGHLGHVRPVPLCLQDPQRQRHDGGPRGEPRTTATPGPRAA